MLGSRKTKLVLATGLVVGGLALGSGVIPRALAHCQIPCGIYDDQARLERMEEDVRTIEKATKRMGELAAKEDAQSRQQFARWAQNKEEHATRIIETVSKYFLTQKLAPVAEGGDGREAYLEALAKHHRVMRAAMKAKQNADPAYAEKLRSAVHELAHHWGDQKQQ